MMKPMLVATEDQRQNREMILSSRASATGSLGSSLALCRTHPVLGGRLSHGRLIATGRNHGVIGQLRLAPRRKRRDKRVVLKQVKLRSIRGSVGILLKRYPDRWYPLFFH